MKPFKWCANGCNKPPKPPSLVICEDCLNAISNKFQEMIDKLEMREKETNVVAAGSKVSEKGE